MGQVIPKSPDRKASHKISVKIKRGGSNRITIRKMFDAERKELTESICLEKSSPVKIL